MSQKKKTTKSVRVHRKVRGKDESIRSPEIGPTGVTQKTTLRLPVDLWKMAAHHAIEERITLQTLVVRALLLYLGEQAKNQMVQILKDSTSEVSR